MYKNELIKFDLHIHSFESAYKEKNGIVDESKIENLDVLLKKLNENHIQLFSITDHNLFSSNLYLTIDEKLSESSIQYPFVKNVIPGVEFDVKFDEEKEKCHVLAYFNAKKQKENYEHIEYVLKSKNPNKNTVYSKEEFEEIFRKIGLDTILIGCQTKDINNHNGKNNALSDSVEDVQEIISSYYINALEYQKPKVEGILLNNFKEFKRPICFVTGSDCHTWSEYPKHDKSSPSKDKFFSKAKILPTFKGLLMAITSPNTRLNRNFNSNVTFIEKINKGEKEIKFSNGINAIIGENGSGKSFLLNFLGNIYQKHEWEKDLIKENELSKEVSFDNSEIKLIAQNELVKNFNENKENLFFGENYFAPIDDFAFEKEINNYALKIKQMININIDLKKKEGKKKRINFKYDKTKENESVFYINIDDDLKVKKHKNQYIEPKKLIEETIGNIEKLLEESFFDKYNKILQSYYEELQKIHNEIHEKCKQQSLKIKIKGVVSSKIKDYNTIKNENSNINERSISDYKKNKQSICDFVIDFQRLKWEQKQKLKFSSLKKVSGTSENNYNGFKFVSEKNYNNQNLEDEFFKSIFVQKYNNIDLIKNIDTILEYSNAVKNCSDVNNIDEFFDKNVAKFLEKNEKTNKSIMDSYQNGLGNTLGEMSLSYYKYFTSENEKWSILLVDQPEDNISNKKINDGLIRLFDSLRDKKQIIFVTHNPLLVVNLDVDNVIYLKKEINNSEIEIKYGCLEYEDEEINILDLIATNMDGGRETIEKRINVYGKNN